jgi:hypothetical protein
VEAHGVLFRLGRWEGLGMAGGDNKGARRDLVITKKAMPNNPSYPPSGPTKKIQKESRTELKSVNIPAGTLKIGVRVKKTENVEQFAIFGKNGRQLVLTPAPPQEMPANNPIALDLGTALGVGADEKWVTYTTGLFDPKDFGKKFDSKLVLNPFDCHPNGIRALLVAITFQGLSFTADHYVYGLSVLPGEHSQAFPIDLLGQPAARPAKKPRKPAKPRRKKR